MTTQKGPYHKKFSRSEVIVLRNIEPEKKDAIDRLKEVCNQGKYRYRIDRENFKNGMMATIKFYYLGDAFKKNTIAIESMFVSGQNANAANTAVATRLLKRLNLWYDDDESEADESGPDLMNFAKGMENLLETIIPKQKKESWADQVEKEEKKNDDEKSCE